MDAKRRADAFGRQLADGVTYACLNEATLTNSHIFQYPVELEPPYRPVDQRQTFESVRTQIATPYCERSGWVTKRVLLPKADKVDWNRSDKHRLYGMFSDGHYSTNFTGSLTAGLVGSLWSRMPPTSFFLLLAGLAGLAAILLRALSRAVDRLERPSI